MLEIIKKNIYFVLGILILLGFLYFISGVKKPPPMPPDAEHRELSKNEDCDPCHGLDGDLPLKATHPPKENCVYCHIEHALKRKPIKYKIIQKIKKEEAEKNIKSKGEESSHGFQ